MSPVYRLARRLGLRRRPTFVTRYGHPAHPWAPTGWDPDPREIR